MNDQEEAYLDKQEEQQLRSAATQTALRAAADHKERTVHNENFLNELRKSDLDDGDFDFDIEGEFADWMSGAHAVTNRGDDWDTQADLIMQNKRERAVAERRPGRLLRDRPFLHATMAGADSPPAEAYAAKGIPGGKDYWIKQTAAAETDIEVLSSRQFRQIYGAAEVAADLMSLGRNGAGLDSVSTVKTETTTRKKESEESTAGRIGRLMR